MYTMIGFILPGDFLDPSPAGDVLLPSPRTKGHTFATTPLPPPPPPTVAPNVTELCIEFIPNFKRGEVVAVKAVQKRLLFSDMEKKSLGREIDNQLRIIHK